MHAIIVSELGGPEALTYTEIDKPQAGPDQVLIKVEALQCELQ